MTKYYTLVLNTGTGWDPVFGDYSVKACRDEFAYAYNEYTHPHFDRTWRTSDSKVVCTDGTAADLNACMAHMNREVDTIATHDAAEIKRLTDKGEPLSTTAAGFGYTPLEAQRLLEHAANNHYILVGWWKEVAA